MATRRTQGTFDVPSVEQALWTPESSFAGICIMEGHDVVRTECIRLGEGVTCIG